MLQSARGTRKKNKVNLLNEDPNGCFRLLGFFCGLSGFDSKRGIFPDKMRCERSVTYFDLTLTNLTKKIQLEIAELEI